LFRTFTVWNRRPTKQLCNNKNQHLFGNSSRHFTPPLTDLSALLEGKNRSHELTTERDYVFKPETAMEILQKKPSSTVYTIKENQTVLDAIAKMEEVNVGALLVLNEHHKLSGIVTERDYLTKVVLRGHKSVHLPVKEIMAKNVVTVLPNVTVKECLNIMTNKRFRHLPVVTSDNHVKGVVSIGDLVKSIIEQQDQTIYFQKRFISDLYTYDGIPVK